MEMRNKKRKINLEKPSRLRRTPLQWPGPNCYYLLPLRRTLVYIYFHDMAGPGVSFGQSCGSAPSAHWCDLLCNLGCFLGCF